MKNKMCGWTEEWKFYRVLEIRVRVLAMLKLNTLCTLPTSYKQNDDLKVCLFVYHFIPQNMPHFKLLTNV